MSGGIAYLYAEDAQFDERNFNMEMIGLEDPSSEDLDQLKELIENHVHYTGSSVGASILKDWKKEQKNFIKVMPTDYKKALARLAEEAKAEVS
jgi:glutamate synthase (ferredoxin)